MKKYLKNTCRYCALYIKNKKRKCQCPCLGNPDNKNKGCENFALFKKIKLPTSSATHYAKGYVQAGRGGTPNKAFQIGVTMDYGYIKAGYAPLETGWYSVSDCLPLMDDYSIGGIMRSRPVLLYLGDCQLVGYLQQWEDKEYVAEWKLSGRDGYNAKNVTHWQWLPLPPNAGAEARHKTSPSTALLGVP